jgi:signal transduction histidine kinase/FixJ family two-component response regulator
VSERTRLNESVLESVKWLSLVLTAVFLGFALHAWVQHGARAAPLAATFDWIAIAVNLAIAVALFRRRVPASYAHGVGAVIALTTSASLMVAAASRQSILDLIYVPFMLVVTGAIALSPVWFYAIATSILTLTLPIAWRILPAAHRAEYLVALSAGALLAVTLFYNRRQAQRDVLRLRESDIRLANSLREALARSESRLREQEQTDRRRQELEDQLRQAQKLEAIGVLAGGVAHDMNNVLGVITSIASLACDRTDVNSPLNQDIEDILAAARRGSALTRNLLGFARQGTRLKERFRMEATVESIVHLLRRAISKQVELKVETATELDDIVGDPGQLSHVLMNLCINAVDATQGHGTITIRAKNLWVDSSTALIRDVPVGRYIELTVSDNGCGIPKDILPRVFEPFFSTKSSSERSGLGLSMVYGTVRDHGGAVLIESHVGSGTKVHVILPSQLKKPASIAPPPIRAVRPVDARRTILLVDDEPLLRSAGRRIIKGLGFEVVVAANGAEAVAVFRHQHEHIALVVLDVAMPVMGGRDCFLRLRDIDPEVPILVASGYAKHGDVDELLSAGATGYLSKPYDRAQMTEAIHRCLSLSLTMPVASSTDEHTVTARNAALP